MHNEEIVLNIVNGIRKRKGLDKILEWKDELQLKDDLQLDSIDLAEVTAKIEDKLEVDVFEDGIVRTLGEINARIKNFES